MNKFNLIIFIIVSIVKLTQLQSIPVVPCPKIFSYVTNSQTGQIEGQITLTITKPGENVLLVTMGYPPDVVNNHAGKIGLTKDNSQTTKDIFNHIPIVLKVDFPTTNPVPTVKQIVSNNEIICSNPASQDDGSEIILTHKLNVPNTIQLAGNSLSSKRKSPSRQKQSNRPSIPSQNFASSGPVSCGTTAAPINLIFGGQKMKPGSWPWLVALFVRDKGQFKYICAGSLITNKGIITAAHCVSISGGIRNPHDMRIGLGIFNIYNWNEPNSQIASVNNIITHPEYARKKVYDADIAIIVLDKAYSYTTFVRPVCLWRDEFGNAINREGQVAGWGVGRIGGDTEPEPSITEAQIVSDQKCLRSNEAFQSITTERNLCAGYRDDKGPCQGDSGSGLIMDIGGVWYLRALVSGALSHVRTTCDLKQYVIYTDVAQFSDWIRQHLSF